jgi:hypothetical protein
MQGGGAAGEEGHPKEKGNGCSRRAAADDAMDKVHCKLYVRALVACIV